MAIMENASPCGKDRRTMHVGSMHCSRYMYLCCWNHTFVSMLQISAGSPSCDMILMARKSGGHCQKPAGSPNWSNRRPCPKKLTHHIDRYLFSQQRPLWGSNPASTDEPPFHSARSPKSVPNWQNDHLPVILRVFTETFLRDMDLFALCPFGRN